MTVNTDPEMKAKFHFVDEAAPVNSAGMELVVVLLGLKALRMEWVLLSRDPPVERDMPDKPWLATLPDWYNTELELRVPLTFGPLIELEPAL